MRKHIALGCFLLAVAPVLAPAQVVLNEVMFDPSGSEYYDEFVELFNLGPDTVNLKGWLLGDQSELDSIIDAGSGLLLAPRQYAVVLDPGYFEHSDTYDQLIPSSALVVTINDGAFGKGGFSNSSPETVYLVSSSGDTVGAYRYSLDNPPGYSDEKIDPSAGDAPNNWANSLTRGGSPGGPNTVSARSLDLALHFVGTDTVITAAGEELQLVVRVQNRGTQPAHGAAILLYWDMNADGQPTPSERIAEQTVPELDPSRQTLVSLPFVPCCPGLFLLRARLSLQGDQRADNNRDSVFVMVPARPRDLLISEIYYRPGSGEPEWVELYNAGQRPLNLAGWLLKDATQGLGAELPLTAAQWLFQPGEYLVIAEDSLMALFSNLEEGQLIVPPDGFPSLNNTGDSVVVVDPVGNRIDRVHYSPRWGGENGVSLERIRFDQPSDSPENWASSVAPSGSTPGFRNSVAPPDTDLALLAIHADSCRLSVPCSLHLLLANLGLTTAQAKLIVTITQGLPCYRSDTLLQPTIAPELAPLDTISVLFEWIPKVPGRAEVRAAIGIRDGRPSNDSLAFAYYVPPRQSSLVINEIQFDPPAGEGEWIEVYNHSEFEVCLDGWLFGDQRRRVRLDSTGQCVPSGGFALIAAEPPPGFASTSAPVWSPVGSWPSLNNSADAVVLLAPTGLLVDSVYYSDSWRRGCSGSLERTQWSVSGLDSASWRPCTDPSGSTPGEINTATPREIDLALVELTAVRAYWPRSKQIRLFLRNTGLTDLDRANLTISAEPMGSSSASPWRVTFPLEFEVLRAGQGDSLEVPGGFDSPGYWELCAVTHCAGDGRAANDTLRRTVYISPTRGAVVINEFYPQPLPGQDEWLELANTTDWEMDLRGWGLRDSHREKTSGIIRDTLRISGRGLLVLSPNSTIVEQWPRLGPTALAIVANWPRLNDQEDEIVLLDPNGLTIDSVHYDSRLDIVEGYSMEKIEPTLPGAQLDSWLRCTLPEGGTPGSPNSVSGALRQSGPALTATPNPFSPNGDGYEDVLLVSIHLPVRSATVRLQVFDLLGRLVATLADDQPCGPNRLFVWEGRTDEGILCKPGAYIVSLRWWSESGASGSALLPVALAMP